MSMAFFCSSLPATPFGHKYGRGTTDMFRTPDIVRLTANPPAQACHLKRWSKYHCVAVDSPPAQIENGPIIPSLPPSPKEFEVEIEKDFNPFLVMHKNDGVERLGRFNGTGYVDGSLVLSKDVIINSDTKLEVRIYLPHAGGLPPQKLPVVVYFHGGAFIVEDIASPPYHNYLTRLAEKANILIVSVNYRLAPEKFLPVAYDDCMEALNWVNSHSSGEGKGLDGWIVKHGDLGCIFLSGDSAGGNITHNLAMRDDNKVNIEGIALVHPYFFGKVPVPTELQDPTNLLLHRKLWSFIAPESEGLDDPRVNPWGPKAPSLSELKCKRAVVFVAGKDFHGERGKIYIEKLRKSGWKGEMIKLCNHDGVGHVYHLSVDPVVEEKEKEAAWKLMTQLLEFHKDNNVVLEDSVLESLKATTVQAIKNMKKIERDMSNRMMDQLVAFYKGDQEIPHST